MTWFADLSPYTYFEPDRRPGLLNIGWLDRAHEFPVGETPPELAATLARLCADERVAQTRGRHSCNLPGDRTGAYGSAEIRVKGEGGVVYAAPELIHHYVTAHRYRPPEGFIAAVLMS